MNDDRPEQLREVAERLVAEAADFVRGRRAEIIGAGSAAVRTKSSPTDPVTLADTETERLVRERLSRLRPGDGILGEEGGGAPSGGAVRWVVDPIDGTVNFLYGIPAYAISLAAQVDGVSVAGAVADVAGGQIYSAAAGLGAHVSSESGRRRLRCNDVDDLSMALLGTGFGYSPPRRAAQAALLAKLMPEVRDLRRLGSAALDLCMVAAGRLDAHYEHGLHEWDWAAGALIASEAGAVVLLPADGPGAGLLLAAAPGVAAHLIEALERCGGLGPLP
ncbi:MAG: inositol monophosphatase family protein [Mycobacterium sp.]